MLLEPPTEGRSVLDNICDMSVLGDPGREGAVSPLLGVVQRCTITYLNSCLSRKAPTVLIVSQLCIALADSAVTVNGDEAAIGLVKEVGGSGVNVQYCLPGLLLHVYHHHSVDSTSANNRKTCGNCGVSWTEASQRHGRKLVLSPYLASPAARRVARPKIDAVHISVTDLTSAIQLTKKM